MSPILLFALLSASLPKLQEGAVPSDPVSGRDGAFALLEVDVSPAGTIVDIVELGGLAPMADLMREHVAGWHFEPARNERDEPSESKVLVAVVNRSPALAGAFPPMPKTPRPAEASEDLPFPERMAMPPVPAQARFSGLVLLELVVDEDGKVASSEVVRSSDGFDGVALDTIQSWEFAPAERDGTAVPARAYVLFSFRPPPPLR
jgi:TonB family protein